MPPVRALPDELVNLIAAGEVVERPSSIVKELVENSLDAGAAGIGVETLGGGRRSVIVRDDGCGMSRHDLLMSVQRHATSKIAAAGDLESISTLGFRGEALPSIAAVTHLRMTTSDGTSEAAWSLSIDGGVLGGVQPAARTRGTTVEASGIFFNQPARRKFLRSEATEQSWVVRHLEGLLFSRDDFSLSLQSEGQRVFDIPAGTLVERMRQRFGIRPTERCVSGSASDGVCRAELTYFPDRRFAGRQHVYIAVNGRPVHSRTVAHALESALSGPAGHPLLVCRLVLDPGEIDVNVHPAKLEVRLRRPSLVESMVEGAVRDATGGRRALYADMPDLLPSARIPSRPMEGDLFRSALEVQQPRERPFEPSSSAVVPMMQVGRSYIVTTVSGGIVVVDQHAAHERVLFECIRAGSGGGPAQQRLLLPERLDLDPEYAELLALYQDVFARAGFEIGQGEDGAVLRAVPAGLRRGADAVTGILAALADPTRSDLPPQDRVAAAAACAGAVKFGDELDVRQAGELIEMLFATSDPFRCPHGRPTLVEISLDELEKRFGR